MPETLSSNDVVYVQQLINQNRLSDAYDYLSDRGYRYADLANGVVSGGTISGATALAHMQQEMLDSTGKVMTLDDINKVRRDMAQGYLDALRIKADVSGNINSDVDYLEAWDFHKKVFNNNGMPDSSWTLNDPFTLMDESLRQEIWDKILDGAKYDVMSVEMLDAYYLLLKKMAEMALSSDLSKKELAKGWLENAMASGVLSAVLMLLPVDYDLQQMLADIINNPELLRDDKNRNGIPDGLESGLERIRSIFNDFLNWLPRRDPLSLDLDGDGLETIAQAGFNGVLFDHDGDGVKTASGWIGRDDGFLSRDLNGNGKIDSGVELFGDSTRLRNGQLAKNGFEALADLDENTDGRIDTNDNAFASLRVWKDANSNGVVDSGELRTLADWGITALNTAHTTGSTNLGDGNQLAERGSYVGANNQLGLMGDLNFSESNFHRTFADHIAPTERTRNLADASGAGMVRDLREAATLSDTVATLVEQYSAATTRSAQMSRIDGLLAAWARTSGFQASEDITSKYSIVFQTSAATQELLGGTNAERIARLSVLERFNGSSYLEVLQRRDPATFGSVGTVGVADKTPVITISVAQLISLDQAYNQLSSYAYEALVLQTRLKPYIDTISLNFDADTSLVMNTTAMQQRFEQAFASDAANAAIDLCEFNRGMAVNLINATWNGYSLLEQQLRTAPVTSELLAVLAEFNIQRPPMGADNITGTTKDDVLLGNDAANVLDGGDGHDVLDGGAGDDTLRGGNGDDTLYGDAYNDTLAGGAGNDTLLGGTGDDLLYGDAGDDRLLGGEGADELNGDVGKDVLAGGTGDDHLFGGQGDDTLQGDAGHDFLDGGIGKDQLSGGIGDDTLLGGDDNDELLGGVGVDDLHGGLGNDVLDSGAGDETLYGDAGDDTYRYRPGDGHDVILETSGFDTLEFAGGIRPPDVTVQREGADIVFVLGADNSVRIKDWYDIQSQQIEQVSFADGTVWSHQYVHELFNRKEGTSGDDELTGNTAEGLGDVLVGLDGDDTLIGLAGDDVLDGGAGADELYAGAGDNQVNGGAGDDIITSADGDFILAGTGVPTPPDMQAIDLLTALTLAGTHSGSNRISGGDGNDTIVVGQGSNIVHGDAGDDLIRAIDGADTLYGDDGSDVILDTGGNNFIDGGAGNDTIVAYAGNDHLLGGDGHDVINDIGGNNVIDGGAGHDTIVSADGADQIFGGDDDDTITDIGGDNVIDGGSGNDRIVVLTGNNLIMAGAGVDIVLSGDGQDRIYAGVDLDIVYAGAGNDEIYGEAGMDTLIGGADDDLLEGGESDDVLIGDGLDLLDELVLAKLEALGQELTLDIQMGADVLRGGSGNDTLLGSGGDDFLYGGADLDRLVGGTGNDLLDGGDGDDLLDGGDGADILVGGSGNDVLGVASQVTEQSAGTGDTYIGGIGDDVLKGSAYADHYLFNMGDGKDRIIENGNHNLVDVLTFGQGITKNDVEVAVSGLDLVISRRGSADSITIVGWNVENRTHIERVEFSDGTFWNETQLQSAILNTAAQSLTQAIAVFNPTGAATSPYQTIVSTDAMRSLGVGGTLQKTGLF